jgi:hypothetical protein
MMLKTHIIVALVKSIWIGQYQYGLSNPFQEKQRNSNWYEKKREGNET